MISGYQETRCDRWIRLPYILMAMMILIGFLSYFLDSRRTAPPITSESQQAKTEDFIKRRIAEHNQTANQTVAKQTPINAMQQSAQKPAVALPVRNVSVNKKSPAVANSGFFTRFNLSNKLSALKRIPRNWLIGFASGITLLIGIVTFALLKRRVATTSLSEEGLIQESVIEPSQPQTSIEVSIAHSAEDVVPSMFSLYSNSDTSDEGSFIETYLKPTISSFGESISSIYRKIINRQDENHDPMHMLIPSMIGSLPQGGMQNQMNSTSTLFRRAIVTKK